jgi:flagellin-like hook-associated protein FlgL
MANDVVLGSALRTNLLSLQRTQSGIDKIQNILATGLKVSSALDNPQNFFAAKGLSDRASDLTRLLDGIGQSISTIQAADRGASAVGRLIDQAESLAQSAQEEIAQNGSAIARVTGNVDLRGVTDLTDLSGVNATDTLTFEYLDKDGETTRTVNIAISADDSIEELITAINDIGQTTSTSTQYGEGEVFSASLDENGGLQIENIAGGSFRLQFEAGGNPDDTFEAADGSLGAALGFGGIAADVSSNDDPAVNSNFEVTALASARLVSGAFYENLEADGFAEASDLLSDVFDDFGGTARFSTLAATTSIEIRVNGEVAVDTADAAGPGGALDLTATSIQGLVDRINANDSLRASYDSSTGEFSIEAADASVQTIEIVATDSGANAAVVDFGFGLKTTADFTLAGAAGDEAGERFVLGAANETLEQIQNDYNTVRTQIDQLVSDSGYRGVNLLANDTLTTFFDENRDSSLNTVGRDLSSAGLGISEANFNSTANITSSLDEILAAKNDVRNFGNAIANSLSIVQTREDFTKDLIAELQSGAEKLTVADQNEEGAKLLALQTRQQLGVTSLSLAVQSQQSVLRLF